jgi:iron complex transport system substrate-binding protein
MSLLGAFSFLLSLLLVASALISCSAAGNPAETRGEAPVNRTKSGVTQEAPVTVTDSAGREVSVPRAPARVVALTSSLCDLWASAGGSLAATSGDTFRERPELAGSIPELVNAGSLLEPNAETILSLDPQFVLLSDSLPAHRKLAALLDEGDIPYYFAKSDTFTDYLAALKDFTAITDRADLYDELGEGQRKAIDALIAKVPPNEHLTVLFMRVSTSKAEALSKDHIVCGVIDDAGAENIAITEQAVLKDLSLEAVVKADPDFIFAVTQGTNAKASEKVLAERFTSSSLWSGLRAVREGRFHVLPKELYQLKPNSRWKDAYEELFKILYPETFQ